MITSVENNLCNLLNKPVFAILFIIVINIVKITSLYLLSHHMDFQFGKDRQSEAQKRYQENIEKAGGTYYIARNFDDFVEFFNDFVNK